MNIFNFLFYNFLPNNCLICGRTLKNNNICSHCEISLKPKFNINRCKLCYKPINNKYEDYCLYCQQYDIPIRYIRYIMEYKELFSIFIKQMKYSSSRKLLDFGSDLLVTNYKKYFGNDFHDIIIPAYSSKKSLEERGFLHTYFLAKNVYKYIKGYKNDVILAKYTDFPDNYKRRAHLPLKLRLRYSKININLRKNDIINKKILFIDDMITTGSSALNLLFELKAYGFKSFDIYTLGVSKDFYSNFEQSLEVYNKKMLKFYSKYND